MLKHSNTCRLPTIETVICREEGFGVRSGFDTQLPHLPVVCDFRKLVSLSLFPLLRMGTVAILLLVMRLNGMIT